MTRVRRLSGTVAARKGHEEVLAIDELLTRIIGGRMNARVHPDGVDRAGLHTVTTEDTAQLVDYEGFGESFVATAGVTLRILPGLDGNALGRTGRRAAETGHTSRSTIVTER